MSTLGLTLNGLATQASKLLLRAVAVLFLTITGSLPATGFVMAILIAPRWRSARS